jgi:hypothetical protein
MMTRYEPFCRPIAWNTTGISVVVSSGHEGEGSLLDRDEWESQLWVCLACLRALHKEVKSIKSNKECLVFFFFFKS